MCEAKDEYDMRVEELEELEAKEFKTLYAKCIEVNGSHVDDGGMFIATCKYCGFSDDYYDPS